MVTKHPGTAHFSHLSHLSKWDCFKEYTELLDILLRSLEGTSSLILPSGRILEHNGRFDWLGNLSAEASFTDPCSDHMVRVRRNGEGKWSTYRSRYGYSRMAPLSRSDSKYLIDWTKDHFAEKSSVK